MEANDRSIASFTMLAHGIFHTYELSIPIFVVIWLETFDVSTAVLGGVVGVGYALIGVGALPSGLLADRYGSRSLIVASIVGMGVGFFLFSLAPNIVILGAALVVWGIAASLYHPAGLSLISRCAVDRGETFAYHGVGGNVGTAFGPLLAALLLLVLDWRTVVVILALPVVPIVLYGYTVQFDEGVAESDEGGATEARADGNGRESSLRSVLRESRTLFTAGFALVFLVVMLYGLYYRGLLTFLPEVMAGLPRLEPVTLLDRRIEPAQYVYTGLLTIGIFGQYAGGRVTDYVRTEYALVTALGVLAVAAVAFLPASRVGLAPFLLVCAFIGFCLYATAPIYQVLIAEYAASDVHGLSYGYTYLGMFGVGAAGAAIAGGILDRFNEPTLFGALGALALVATGLVVVLLGLPSEEAAA